MFTGIVQEVAKVAGFEKESKPKAKLFIEALSFKTDVPELGESVSICGACLTVVDCVDSTVCFELAEETLRRTKFSEIVAGSRVNIERSLRFGGRIDGHFVLGHVDTVATLRAISADADAERYEFQIDSEYLKYIPEKGSVTIDGVSLTVGHVSETGFDVYIIPHTKKHTLFADYKEGSLVNIEVDCLARYLEKLVSK